jgi:hypothetical protein
MNVVVGRPEWPPGASRHRRSPASRHSARAALLGWLVLGLSLGGCRGDSGRIPVYSAKGKVTIFGEPPDGALVVLYPAKGGAEAEPRPSGRVKPDGTFSLTTYDAGDGAPAGEYTATIQWNKLIKQGQDYKAGPNIVPRKYAARDSSPWKIRVTEASNDLAPLDIKK